MNEIVYKNKLGFTLLETIIVLIIILGLGLFPIMTFPRLKEQAEINEFLGRWETHYHSIQQYAILYNKYTTMITLPDRNTIAFRIAAQPDHPLVDDLVLPRGMDLTTDSVTYRMKPGTGILTEVNTITVTSPTKKILIKFQVGSGKYAIEKYKR